MIQYNNIVCLAIELMTSNTFLALVCLWSAWMHVSDQICEWQVCLLMVMHTTTTLIPWFSCVSAVIVCLEEHNHRHCLSHNPFSTSSRIKFNSIQFKSIQQNVVQFMLWCMCSVSQRGTQMQWGWWARCGRHGRWQSLTSGPGTADVSGRKVYFDLQCVYVPAYDNVLLLSHN